MSDFLIITFSILMTIFALAWFTLLPAIGLLYLWGWLA